MLREKGSAVDAVIATAFCMGVFNEHVTGLGRFVFFNGSLVTLWYLNNS